MFFFSYEIFICVIRKFDLTYRNVYVEQHLYLKNGLGKLSSVNNMQQQ